MLALYSRAGSDTARVQLTTMIGFNRIQHIMRINTCVDTMWYYLYLVKERRVVSQKRIVCFDGEFFSPFTLWKAGEKFFLTLPRPVCSEGKGGWKLYLASKTCQKISAANSGRAKVHTPHPELPVRWYAWNDAMKWVRLDEMKDGRVVMHFCLVFTVSSNYLDC